MDDLALGRIQQRADERRRHFHQSFKRGCAETAAPCQFHRSRTTPKAPNMQTIPTLGPKVCNQGLRWAFWSRGNTRSPATKHFNLSLMLQGFKFPCTDDANVLNAVCTLARPHPSWCASHLCTGLADQLLSRFVLQQAVSRWCSLIVYSLPALHALELAPEGQSLLELGSKNMA